MAEGIALAAALLILQQGRGGEEVSARKRAGGEALHVAAQRQGARSEEGPPGEVMSTPHCRSPCAGWTTIPSNVREVDRCSESPREAPGIQTHAVLETVLLSHDVWLLPGLCVSLVWGGQTHGARSASPPPPPDGGTDQCLHLPVPQKSAVPNHQAEPKTKASSHCVTKHR